MSARFWLSGLIVVAGMQCQAAMAEESPAEPTLGRAEPIGSLEFSAGVKTATAKKLTPGQAKALTVRLQIQASTVPPQQQQVVTASLVDIEPELGAPVPLASLIDSATKQKTRGVIAQHLKKTAHLLDAAGLADESLTVEGILMDVESKLEEFESNHRDRLLLALKRSALQELQGEIEKLETRLAQNSSDMESADETDGDDSVVLPVNFPATSPVQLPR